MVRIIGQQLNNRPLPPEPLDRYLVSDTRHDDISVDGMRRAMHREQITVEYTGAFHAVTAHPQQIIGTRMKNGRINRTVFLDILFGEDRLARRNAAHHGQAADRGIDKSNTAGGTRHQFDNALACQGAQVILRCVCGAETQPSGNFGARWRATL